MKNCLAENTRWALRHPDVCLLSQLQRADGQEAKAAAEGAQSVIVKDDRSVMQRERRKRRKRAG